MSQTASRAAASQTLAPRSSQTALAGVMAGALGLWWLIGGLGLLTGFLRDPRAGRPLERAIETIAGTSDGLTGLVLILVGVWALVVGGGLLRRQSWARVAAIATFAAVALPSLAMAGGNLFRLFFDVFNIGPERAPGAFAFAPPLARAALEGLVVVALLTGESRRDFARAGEARQAEVPGALAPPVWRDLQVLRVAGQVVFAVLVIGFLWYLYNNLFTNLRTSGLPTGFDYLNRPAGVDIRDSPFRPSQPVRDAIVVGFVNTIRVSVVGIALATLIGVLIGIARLSSNWLVRKFAAFYVESLRNIPVLVIIIFFYVAVVLKLPPIQEALETLGLMVFSNRGLAVPWGEAAGAVRAFLGFIGGGLALAVIVGLWRTRRFDETGQPHHRVLWGTAILVVVVVASYVALGRPVELTIPTRDGRLVEGGITLGPEYAALLIGLVLYTASHIAEIVRGSILAVPKGQFEAAQALALTGFQRMRFVILPQALRIMIPPLANQYLNLTKNSSLAVAVGYFELTRITGQIIANGNPAPQSIAILMAAYLLLSLTISFFANVVNRRLSLESP